MADSTRTDIRVRRTLKADWTEEETPLVFCPGTGATRPLSECSDCARNVGVERDAAGHWFLTCRNPSPTANAPAGPADRSWETTRVCEVMTGSPVCVHQDVELAEVVALVVEQGISGAPVVDDEGRPVGLVSQSNLLMEEYESHEEHGPNAGGRKTRVRDLMTSGCICVAETATLLEAVNLMAREGVHRLPVVSGSQRVVGVLSTLDVVRALAARTSAAP